MDALIKNVDKGIWKKFKIEAIKKDKNLGDFFYEIISNIGEDNSNWDKIKKHKGLLNDEDAESLKEIIFDFRKGFKLRY